MLTKLAVASLKHRIKDFLILFTGLIIAVAIFYLFSTLATNRDFLETNTSLRAIVIIFIIGQVLLGGMTLVYLNFANRFLLQLRQRDYGLLMMFGASKAQVGRLMFYETVLIGALSLLLGSIVGAGLTGLSAWFLQDMLAMDLPHWAVLTPAGVFTTLLFFIIVFLLSGLWNRFYLKRQTIQTLLKADQTAETLPKKSMGQVLQSLLGLVLLVMSYVIMGTLANTQVPGLITALLTNVLGTYFVISAGLTLLLQFVQKLPNSYRGLRRFTIGQLRFRLRPFNRILTVVTVMFAMALGALSVGRGYQMALPVMAASFSPYTLAVKEPTQQEKQWVNALQGVDFKASYHYQVHDDQINWREQDFVAHPLPVLDADKLATMAITDQPRTAYTRANVSELKQDTYPSDLWQLSTAVTQGLENFQALQHQFVHDDQLASSDTQQLMLVRVQNLTQNHELLQAITDSQIKRFGASVDRLPGAFPYFALLLSLFGGLAFMSFFLAIAFLTMLASTLMFKILSNAQVDQQRYRILTMIGATKQQRQRALAFEIGLIFAIPLTIGLIDVLVGLRMFDKLMPDAYLGLPSALVVIGGFYLAYYVLTIWLYQRFLNRA
jgi:putative ABC transport system permease protein